MKKTLQAAMLAAVLSSGAGAALAADVISESRGIDARAVTVYGNPANRHSNASGMGSVRWQ